MRQNIEELPALIEFASAHGAHQVLATNTIIYDRAMEHEALYHHPDLTRKMVVEAIRRAKKHAVRFDNRVLTPAEGVQMMEAEAEELDQDTSEHIELPAHRELFPALHRVGRFLRKWGWSGTGVFVFASDCWQCVKKSLAHLKEEDAFHAGPDSTYPALENQTQPAVAKDIFAPANNSVSRLKLPLKKERSDILKACQMPWSGLMVESDGNVKVCCYTSPYIGNLNEQTFEEIWNGPPIKALRRSFLEGRPPEGCRNCFIFTKSQPREAVFIQPITT